MGKAMLTQPRGRQPARLEEYRPSSGSPEPAAVLGSVAIVHLVVLHSYSVVWRPCPDYPLVVSAAGSSSVVVGQAAAGSFELRLEKGCWLPRYRWTWFRWTWCHC